MSMYLVAVSISLINFEYVPCKGPVFISVVMLWWVGVGGRGLG